MHIRGPTGTGKDITGNRHGYAFAIVTLTFWQLSLTCESDDFKGWAGEETIVPDTATVTTVRLVPTENGWRVDALELPN